MKNIEIERKYLVKKIPFSLSKYKHIDIEQSFIYIKPAIRVRKAGNKYFLTVKSKAPSNVCKSDLARTEFEIEITKKAYTDLSKKIIGRKIVKTRYLIPYKKHTIELDVFKGVYKGLIYAEVEFKDIKSAKKFVSPGWFYKDVTGIEKYKNTSLAISKKIIKNGK